MIKLHIYLQHCHPVLRVFNCVAVERREVFIRC